MQKPVNVSVIHGNMAFAQDPVAVGHYAGGRYSRAESYLNRCLENRLLEKATLGLYPGARETAGIFLNPNGYAIPRGAVVVGLGQATELTPQGLVKTYTRAALSYALAVAESTLPHFAAKPGEPKSAPITTMLMGTGAAGISVEDSVLSMLRGLRQANLALVKSGSAKHVVLDRIEFIEIWQDTAIMIARALERRSDDVELRDHFDLGATRIRPAPGGWVRAAFEDRANRWQHLAIQGDAGGSLRFSLMTGRARAEVSTISTQRPMIDKLIDDAITRTGMEEATNETLFDLLLPKALKEKVFDYRDLILVMNDQAAHYPWELLEDPSTPGGRPVAVKTGMLRQLETHEPAPSALTSMLDKALVISDPRSAMPALPSAQTEGEMVRNQLLNNETWDVRHLNRAKGTEIIEELYADTYRVLHLTGHGVYKKALPGTDRYVTGMVIGDELFLTPAVVAEMRQPPELVFINCCYLGRIDGDSDAATGDRPRLAANLAAEFIRMGVRVVIAAGWAVDDAAALTFAKGFYRQMLAGASLGRAVQYARAETYNRHGGVNTFGAYQCYGDPDYVLTGQDAADLGLRQVPTFHLPTELVAELHNLESDALTATDEKLGPLGDRLKGLTRQVPDEWLKLASVQAALGVAHGALGMLAEAIEHCEAALEAEKADYPMSVVPRLCEFKTRQAMQLWRENGKPEATGNFQSHLPSAEGQTDKAVELLRRLCEVAGNSEWSTVLARSFQRLALVSSGNRREDALGQMALAYKDASELAQKRKGADAVARALDWLAARVILAWRSSEEDAQFQKRTLGQLEEIALTASKQGVRESNGESLWVLPKCVLLRHLVQGDMDSRWEEIVGAFKDERVGVANRQQFVEMLEYLDFLREMVRSEVSDEGRRMALADALDKIYHSASTELST